MTFILKKIEAPSKEEIKDLIAKNGKLLDKHLELIGGSLETRGETMWDLVGIDKDRRLVLIDVELRYTDKMLHQIVSRLDWAWEHIDNITKMHSSYEINCDQIPRAIIIAPSYLSSFKKNITYLTYRMKINLFTYTYLESDAGKGIFLEPIETRVKYEQVIKSDSRDVKPIEAPRNPKVTTEEIMEFLH